MRWNLNDPGGMIRANEADGTVSLGDRRALVLDIEGLRQVRNRLVQSMGVLEAGKLLGNWGYANGYQDAISLKRSSRRKSKLDRFRAGLDLLAMRGFARVGIVEGSLEEDKEGVLISVEWSSPWEFDCTGGGNNETALQACTTITGYLSGFASAVIDGAAIFVDTKCCGRGDERCFAMAKHEWTDEDEEMLRKIGAFGEGASFENASLSEIIAANEPVTERIRELISEVEAQREEIRNLQDQVQYLQELSITDKPLKELIGTSAAYKRAMRQAETVAATDTTVLLQGETGTGKELFARYIHANSHLKNKPLVTVNCAALPSSLVESELFGHEKGSFTGAAQRKSGRFELANGGTIFLDEVGELPPETQVKLLRVLQEGEFERVGGTQTIKVKVRLLAATNRDLEEMVTEGTFRSDLFYRLNVFPIRIPPLRERGNDIVLLVNYFAQRFRKQFHKPLNSVSRASIERLRRYDFPGNVRELQHLIERSVLLSEGEVLEVDVPEPSGKRNEVLPDSDSKLVSLEEMERRYIRTVLQGTGGVIAGKGGAAEILDLPPSTLRSRMKKLGIK